MEEACKDGWHSHSKTVEVPAIGGPLVKSVVRAQAGEPVGWTGSPDDVDGLLWIRREGFQMAGQSCPVDPIEDARLFYGSSLQEVGPARPADPCRPSRG
jgi:hypothetical protein